MSDKAPFLSRWSQRKTEARDKGEALAEPVAPAPAPPATAEALAPEAREPLPPVESLTPESDFRPFMKPDVDEGVKRQALKTLFRDERYNVMDGLDTYIADFSQPDPIPESWLGQLRQVARLGDYHEPPAEPTAEGSAEGAAEGSAGGANDSQKTDQKGESNQGLDENPSSSSSDTASSPIPPSEVKE